MNRLSIITINYNDAQGLEKTIQSVITQSYRDFEYIVIDGNSSDSSKDVLDKYKAHLNVAISEPDTGIYNAMNKGASHANGEYLLFLNSGDYLAANNVLECLFSQHPKSDIVSSRDIVFTAEHSTLKIPPKNVSLFTFVGGSLPHPSTLIKRKLFEDIGGYSEKYRIISDWCFFVEALLRHNATYSTTDITLAMFNGYGISSTKGATEEGAKIAYLQSAFGRIMQDYLPIHDEAISNVAFWASNQKGIKKTLITFPFKVINRLLRLRNILSRRMGVIKLS